MDELIRQEQEREFLEIYKLLMRGNGGEIWLQREYGRNKSLLERAKITSPLLVEYQAKTESEKDALKEQIKQQEKTIKEQQQQIEKLQAEKEEQDALNIQAIEGLNADIENLKNLVSLLGKQKEDVREEAECYVSYIEEVESERDGYKAKAQAFQGKGKALELPLRVVREVVQCYGLGFEIMQIVKKTGASRGQVSRVINGNLKSAASKKRVLKAINQALKENQNPQTLEKLKALKNKYI